MTGFRFDNIVGDTGDLVMIQGKTCYFTLVWGNTTPVDVTGFTAKLVAKKSPSATSKILECTIANGRAESLVFSLIDLGEMMEKDPLGTINELRGITKGDRPVAKKGKGKRKGC